MVETDAKIQKKHISICCMAWRVALVILVVTYILCCIRFDRKVKLFNNGLQIGVQESEAIITLGSPTFLWLGNADTLLGPSKADGKKYDVLVYSGLPFLRENLVLYFDSETRMLVKKGRGSHALGWRPLV